MPFPQQVERWRALVRDLSPDDLKDDPGFQRIVLATITAESGGNPNAVGDQGHSIGLAQLHDQGMGSGLSVAQRSDPRVNLGRAVPALAQAYRATRGDPAHTYIRAINPGAVVGGPQVSGVMAAYQQGGDAVANPRQPSTAPGSWRGQLAPTAPKGPTRADRVRAQIKEFEDQAKGLRDDIAALSTPTDAEVPKSDAEALSPFFEATSKAAYQKRKDAIDDKQKQLAAIETSIRSERTKLAAGDYDEKPEKPSSTRPTTTAPGSPSERNVLVTYPDGHTEWEPNPNYTPPRDPTALTDYQRGELGLRGEELGLRGQEIGISAAHLPIYQQQADASSLSAAASMLHAQVARGQLDFDAAKKAFDYIVAQHAPVEEGGKLYNAGFSPSNPVRQFYHLDPEPYNVVDAASFFGRPELNQYVHGSYPFGAGPMSPDEYHQRQAGAFQAPPPPAPPAPAPPPAPDASMAANQGGFAPPAPEPAPPQPPRTPPLGGDPNHDKIRAMLVQQGVDPEVADQAAADYVRHLAGGVAAQ